MKKEKIYKMKISNICYPTCVEFELDAIKKLFGEYEIIKVRQCFGGFNMKIWFKTKRTTNEHTKMWSVDKQNEEYPLAKGVQ